MDELLGLFLIMAIVLGFFAWFTNKYAAFWYKVFVNNQFEAINTIMLTEDVPASWRIIVIDSLARKNSGSTFWRGVYRLLYRWYGFRLGRLATEVKRLSMIKDEDKQEYIDAFKEIRSAWSSSANDN